MVVKIAEGKLQTKYGEFHEMLFYDGQKESFALVMGEINGAENVFCRVHSSCIFAHHFNSIECDCREQMAMSQQLIQQEGKGIVIWLDQEGKANGHFALLKSKVHKKAGMSQAASYEKVGFKKDARDFTKAAEILQEIGVKSIIMLTNNPKKVSALSQHGVLVNGTKAIQIEVGDNEILRKDLEDKRKDGHSLNLD